MRVSLSMADLLRRARQIDSAMQTVVRIRHAREGEEREIAYQFVLLLGEHKFGERIAPIFHPFSPSALGLTALARVRVRIPRIKHDFFLRLLQFSLFLFSARET